MKLSRDSALWWWGIGASIVLGLASLGNLQDYGLPDAWLPYLRLAALIVGIISGKLATSPLPGAPKDDQVSSSTTKRYVLLLPVLLALSLTGCASAGARHQATIAATAITEALGAVQDAEAVLYQQGQLTTDQHRGVNAKLAIAFKADRALVTGVLAWQPGGRPPADVPLATQAVKDAVDAIILLIPDGAAKQKLAPLLIYVDQAVLAVLILAMGGGA